MVMAYGPQGFVEHACNTVEEIEPYFSNWPVVWVNVSGLADIAMVEELGNYFNLERLLLEDVLDLSHRPKVEFYEHYIYTILKRGSLTDQFESEQVSVFVKKNVVLVFQERPSHGFEQVRERITARHGQNPPSWHGLFVLRAD